MHLYLMSFNINNIPRFKLWSHKVFKLGQENFPLKEETLILGQGQKFWLGSARLYTIYLWYKLKVCMFKESCVMVRTIFFMKSLTLKNKIGQGQNFWWRALLLNTIYLCSKFEVLMSKGIKVMTQTKFYYFFLNLTLSKTRSRSNIIQ